MERMFEFKMGCKAAETTHNINNTFGPVCNSLTFANECTVQWRIKKFRKGDDSLEGEHSGQPSKVDDWEQSSKLILQLHEKLPKNSGLPILCSFSIWSKFERWKNSVSGYLMNWVKIKFFLCNNDPFLKWIMMCMIKSGFYMTTSDGAEKKLQSTSQSQTCTKKKSWSLFGVLLPVWSTIAFWIPAKPLHLRSMRSKSRCTENCLPAAGTGQQKGPDLRDNTRPHISQLRLQKLNKLGYQLLPHQLYSLDLLPTDYHFKHLDNFLQGKRFHNQQDAENAFQELVESRSTDFLCYKSKQTYFSLAKMYWL